MLELIPPLSIPLLGQFVSYSSCIISIAAKWDQVNVQIFSILFSGPPLGFLIILFFITSFKFYDNTLQMIVP